MKIEKINADLVAQLETQISEIEYWKQRFQECKEIILRNNYKLIYEQEIKALNDSLINSQPNQISKFVNKNNDIIFLVIAESRSTLRLVHVEQVRN